MHKTAHPNYQKKISSAVNSCQSAVKLDLKNLLNNITLPSTELHKTLQINIISTPTNHWCTVSPKMSTLKKIQILPSSDLSPSQLTTK